jgi:hypothetical protein
MSSRFQRRDAEVISSKPIISFTFDDFPCSALEIGGKQLEERGWFGTYYASIGLADSEAPTGRIFGIDMLKEVIQRGHELGCHTFAHCNGWDTPAGAFEESVKENARALAEIVPGAGFSSLAYPIAGPSPAIKRSVSKYFKCCRGGGQKINGPRLDLNNLAAFFLEKCRDSEVEAQSIIEQNSTRNGWLIFATHDISDSPTRYGCTPGFFSKILRLVERSGATVLPVSRALEILRSQVANTVEADEC